jgi:hypothetical protein
LLDKETSLRARLEQQLNLEPEKKSKKRRRGRRGRRPAAQDEAESNCIPATKPPTLEKQQAGVYTIFMNFPDFQ